MIVLTSGCASTYKPINLRTYQYSPAQKVSDFIRVSYVGNIQYLSKNRWYSKKERKWNMLALGVKIENQSSIPITITKENLKVYVNDHSLRVLSPQEYSEKVRQRVGVHLLHSLYGPWAISWTESSNGRRDVKFIYIPVGAIIGIGNAIRANKANKANAAEIQRQQIWNKTIAPGDVEFGVILLPARSTDSVLFSAD